MGLPRVCGGRGVERQQQQCDASGHNVQQQPHAAEAPSPERGQRVGAAARVEIGRVLGKKRGRTRLSLQCKEDNARRTGTHRGILRVPQPRNTSARPPRTLRLYLDHSSNLCYSHWIYTAPCPDLPASVIPDEGGALSIGFIPLPHSQKCPSSPHLAGFREQPNAPSPHLLPQPAIPIPQRNHGYQQPCVIVRAN